MEKDVQGKMERLCERYGQTAITIERAHPIGPVSGREIRKAQTRVVDQLVLLQSRRRSSSRALVRLAYVRGKRSQDPQSRLTEYDRARLEILQADLERSLRQAEAQTLVHFRRYVKRLGLGRTMQSYGYPPASVERVSAPAIPYPLEERARVILTRTLETAHQEGLQAVDGPTEYDGERHVR